ncbi:hypothetical protein Golob_020624, partial [Gossypium lobatum]|nr:hypothetical protein [Gossypium lobatum]
MEATKIPPPQQMEDKEEKESPEDEEEPKSGGGWGGWVFSTFSVLSDLQKAAAVAAEEIALNASGVAENAAKNIADIQAVKTIGLEHSAVNFADSMHHGGLPAGSFAPSLIKTRKPFTTKGMQVLEYVGKETMELLINETEEVSNPINASTYTEVQNSWRFNFLSSKLEFNDSNDYNLFESLNYNDVRNWKHYPAITPFYLIEEKLKEIQQITSDSGMDGNDLESAKGKAKDSHDEMKILHDSSIRKYADMAVGFINALAGLAVNDIIQRTTRRLESLHSEGVHLVSQMCRLAVSHLLMLGKSVISSGNKVRVEDPDDDDGDDIMNIGWPEDPVEKAKLIRVKAQSWHVIRKLHILCNQSLRSSRESATVDSHEALPQASIQEKAKSFSEHLHDDRATARGEQNLGWTPIFVLRSPFDLDAGNLKTRFLNAKFLLMMRYNFGANRHRIS